MGPFLLLHYQANSCNLERQRICLSHYVPYLCHTEHCEITASVRWIFWAAARAFASNFEKLNLETPRKIWAIWDWASSEDENNNWYFVSQSKIVTKSKNMLFYYPVFFKPVGIRDTRLDWRTAAPYITWDLSQGLRFLSLNCSFEPQLYWPCHFLRLDTTKKMQCFTCVKQNVKHCKCVSLKITVEREYNL